MPLVLLLVPFALLSNGCKNGPVITGCVVDSKLSGYQCVYKKKEFFTPFEKSGDLKCASPLDTEEYLKACKKGNVLIVTLCSFVKGEFECVSPIGGKVTVPASEVDNYFCLGEKDRNRIQHRCEANQ